MADYSNDLTGVISKNETKVSETHPDIKGQCEINGVQYWIDGWARTRKSDGGKFYSLKFKAKDAKPAAKPTKQVSSGFNDMEDDLIPF